MRTWILLVLFNLMLGTVNANAYRVDLFRPQSVKEGTRRLVCSFNIGDNKATGLLPGLIIAEAIDVTEEKFKSKDDISKFWESIKITTQASEAQDSEEIEVIATLDPKNSKSVLSSIAVTIRNLTRQRIINHSAEVKAHGNTVDYRGAYSKDLDLKVRCLLKSP